MSHSRPITGAATDATDETTDRATDKAANNAGRLPSPSATPQLRPPVVDIKHSQDPSQELHNALLANGFVAVRNCDISAEQLALTFRSAHTFFAQSKATKDLARYRDTQKNFGYQPLHSEALDPAQAADRKESFTMRNIISSANPSGTPADFGATADAMFEACSRSAMHLISLLEEGLGAPQGSISTNHTGENMTLRYLHYPVLFADAELSTAAGYQDHKKSSLKDEKKRELGAGAHTDYGTITLLFSDGVAGLQLRDSAGDWRDVEVAPGDVLVNTGDLMSIWSNGLYPSTLHRVQPRLSQPARYSLAFFVDPDSATRVSPLPCCVTEARPAIAHEIVAGEHIQARIEASQRPT